MAQIPQGAEEAKADEVLGGTLPEAESRVEDQPLGRNAKRPTARSDRCHLVEELLGEVHGALARSDLAAVVHHDDRHAAVSGELQHLITSTRSPDVVQHVRPRVERCGGNVNLLRVGAERQRGQHSAETLNGGNEPCNLVCRRDFSVSWTC